MINGFTLNGIHCSSFGVAMVSKDRTVLPQSNDIYTEIPGRNGSYLFDRELADRNLSLDCGLLTNNATELRTTIRQISAWLYTKQRVKLVFDDEQDKYYLAKCVGAIGLDQVQTVRMGKFTLVFRCDPMAYSNNDKTLVLDDFLVLNDGTAPAYPIFTVMFLNPATEFKLALGSDFVRVVKTFAVNDVLEIDHTLSKVTVNGVRAMAYLDWQDSKFFSLPAGLSQLIVTPAGTATVTLNFTERWL